MIYEIVNFIQRNAMINNFKYMAVALLFVLIAGCGGRSSPPPTYKISGTLSGLGSGNQLVLLNNGGNATTVGANGSFSFSTSIAKNGSYAVTVKTQPTNQTCVIGHDSGSGVTADVNSVAVVCSYFVYTLSGTISGLDAGKQVTLLNNMGNNTTVNANGIFSFTNSIPYLGDYAVTVGTQPGGQLCTITNGNGTGVIANINSVAINCVSNTQFSYVVNKGSSSVSAFSVDSATGALTTAGLPIATGMSPLAVAIDPERKFLYVANKSLSNSSFDSSVSVFNINNMTGVLTEISGSPFQMGGRSPASMIVDPAGKFLYVTDPLVASIMVFKINKTTGALSSKLVNQTQLFNTGIIINPAGKYAYITDAMSNKVSAFDINSSTGELTAISGSPFFAGNATYSVAMDSTGKFAYVTNYSDSTVSVFGVNSSTGALTAVGSAVPTGNNPMSVVLSPDGKFTFVVNNVGNSISVFSINSTTGALTAVAGSPFSTAAGPTAISIDANSRFAYVVNSSGVSTFSIGSTTGVLTAVSGSPLATGGNAPYAISIK